MCLQWWKQPPDGWKHILCPMPLPRTLSWALKSKSCGNMAPQKELSQTMGLISETTSDTWAKEHGTEWVYHIPCHAPASGKIKRYNGLLKTALRAMGGGTSKHWDTHLAKATWLVSTRGSANRAGPAQSKLLRTVKGDKVPVVHIKSMLGKTVWVIPALGKGKPIRGTAFAQRPGCTWWVMREGGEFRWVHKKLGGGTARTADPNCPKGYSIPYGVMLSIETGGSWLGGRGRCLGMGWASVSGWSLQCTDVDKQNNQSHAWQLNHFPGQPVPMLDNPFSEEIFPNIQSKPHLVQLEAISSRPMACYLGEETDPHLSTTSFQAVVESNKVSPQPPFLQAKQPQFPQPLLIRLVLQTLHQLRCPSLDTLQHLNVSLVVRGPKLHTVFEVQPHQC
ncbi:hypothetical protein QYF61_027054 [Mycteria americana]|uniref:Uncharacterized protein n=1 Tax=Mycteria americana TaxID=33587 RepID=A0AAN7N3M9_MYCAM|nr:hypothetical protein QYF61_027054 [Mycteria americana]